MSTGMQRFDLDEILNIIGGWGRYQKLCYFSLCLVIIFAVFPPMSYIFIARDIKYRCKVDACEEENGTYNPSWLKDAVPFHNDLPRRCQFYAPLDNSTCTSFNESNILACNDFVYERDETTIVHDFDITCEENLWKLTIIGTINVLGKICCLPFAGFLSDRFGRKSMIFASVVMSTIMGLAKSFSISYYMFLAFEFLDTALGSGMYSGAFILALEMVDSKRHNMGNIIVSCAFTVGHVLVGVAAWMSPTWRFMLRATYGFGPLVLIFLWFNPESLRWLISKNKITEAERVLKIMAKINGTELSEETLKSIPYLTSESPEEGVENAKELKTRDRVIRIIHSSFTWICCNFPYYGLAIESVELFDDVYTNFMCTSLVEIPAYLLCYFAIEKLGRKRTLAFSLILAGVACVSVDFVSKEYYLALAIFLCGKFFVTIAYTTLYIFVAELFPTSSRHSSFAICVMFGCLGSMMAPQVPLLAKIFKPLPLMTFAAMAFAAGFLAFLFPETYHKKFQEEKKPDAEIQ